MVTFGVCHEATGIGLPDLYREFEKVCGTSVWEAQIRPLGGGFFKYFWNFHPENWGR